MKKIAEVLTCIAVAFCILALIWTFFVPFVKWSVIITLVFWTLCLLVEWWGDCDGFMDYLAMVLNGVFYFVGGFSLCALLIRAIFKVNCVSFIASWNGFALALIGLFGLIIGMLFDRAREMWG